MALQAVPLIQVSFPNTGGTTVSGCTLSVCGSWLPLEQQTRRLSAAEIKNKILHVLLQSERYVFNAIKARENYTL